MQKDVFKHIKFRYYLFLFNLHLPNKLTTIMKTPTAKKRIIEIVDKLLNSTMIEPEINLSFCDMFNKYACLDIDIAVFLTFNSGGFDENYQSFFSCSSVNVTKFDLLDESSDRVLSNSQESELVRMISQYISDYYDNKGKRHI